MPESHSKHLKTRLGRGELEDFRIRGACCGRGRPGEGGGELKTR
jgi:hypothetical protein